MQTFCEDATADGNYPSADGVNPSKNDNVVVASGEFDGATVKFQISPDGTAWVDIEDASLTDEGTLRIQLSQQMKVRVVISGAGAGTEVTVKAA